MCLSIFSFATLESLGNLFDGISSTRFPAARKLLATVLLNSRQSPLSIRCLKTLSPPGGDKGTRTLTSVFNGALN